MNNNKKIAYLLLIIISLMLNILNIGNTGIDFIIIVTATIIDVSLLFSYIMLPEKPILVNCLLLLRQFIIFLQDLYMGSTLGDAIVYNGIFIITIMIMLIIQTNMIDTKSDNIKDRIKELICFERKPFKIKLWIQIIIYSILVICITTLTKNEFINIISDDISIKLLSTLAIVLPIFEIIALASTSNVSYIIIIVYEITKIYTLISLFTVGGLNIQTLLYSILQLLVIVYSILKYFKGKSNGQSK